MKVIDSKDPYNKPFLNLSDMSKGTVFSMGDCRFFMRGEERGGDYSVFNLSDGQHHLFRNAVYEVLPDAVLYTGRTK